MYVKDRNSFVECLHVRLAIRQSYSHRYSLNLFQDVQHDLTEVSLPVNFGEKYTSIETCIFYKQFVEKRDKRSRFVYNVAMWRIVNNA